jgi:hypothetical protein
VVIAMTSIYQSDRYAAMPFSVAPNGDDARFEFGSDTYAEAETWAKANSHDWLGMALFGPSGRIATFKDGVCTGYLDATTRQWVTS